MYTTYNSMFPYQQMQMPQMPQYQQPLPKMEIVKVNGRNGAEAFQMGINSSVLLLDESAPIIWLKTTDGAGYPTLSPYSITPYQPEPIVDTKSLESRIARLERIYDEQSNVISNKYVKDDATDTTDETNNANAKRGAKSKADA